MNKRVIKTAIIISWCLLIACVVMKLCGSKVFEIATENNRFMQICNWLDNEGGVTKYIIGFVMYYISTLFIITASSLRSRLTIKQWIVVSIIMIAVWAVKFWNTTAAFIVEALELIIIPAIISKKWWTGFVGTIFNILFQVLSLVIKGATLAAPISENTLISLCISLDYYIMIALYYMYVRLIIIKKKQKEVTQ